MQLDEKLDLYPFNYEPIISNDSVTFKDLPIPNAVHCFEDSFYLPNFVQTCLKLDTEHLFHSIGENAPWTNPKDEDFQYRGNELLRQKAFWSRVTANEPLPIDVDAPPRKLFRYGYPGFQYGSMEHYRPFERTPDVLYIANQLQDHLRITKSGKQLAFNHVIGTRYRGKDDNIGFHSDKIRDITPNTPIVSISLGETRELHFGRLEKTTTDKNGKSIVTSKTIFEKAIVLQPGDVFILGPKTNLLHQHSIVPVSNECKIQRDSNQEIGPRISLVLRDIATSISLDVARARAKVTTEKRNARKVKKQMTEQGASSKKRSRDSDEHEIEKWDGASDRKQKK